MGGTTAAMAAAKEMVRSGRADMRTAAERCGVTYKALHNNLRRDARRREDMLGVCGYCTAFKQDTPTADEGICMRSRKDGAPRLLSSYRRVGYGDRTGRWPFCPYRDYAL